MFVPFNNALVNYLDTSWPVRFFFESDTLFKFEKIENLQY